MTTLSELEAEFEKISETTDGMDFYSTICLIADSAGDDIRDFIQSSLYKDLLGISQSNPENSHKAILRLIELDEAMGEF